MMLSITARMKGKKWRLMLTVGPSLGIIDCKLKKLYNHSLKQNAELRELFQTFAETWQADCGRQNEELLNAVRATAQEQVPFNVQGYLDEFSKSLAAEVRMLLGEVGRLREERRALQYELGCLMCMRSKYGPGGEFEPDWKPTTGPLAQGPPNEPPPPPEAPPPPEPARPGWRSVPPRGTRRTRKKSEPPPPPSAPAFETPMAPMMDPRVAQAGSWATWQPDPRIEYTPPPVEPTTLLAPPEPHGLFGPRSPRDSVRRG